MRQLRDIWRLNETEYAISGYLGIIYLSWKFSAATHNKHIFLFQDTWRQYVERKVEVDFKNSIFYEGSQWMKNDLFIQIRLPAGHHRVLEGWLLELGHKHTAEWEKSFDQELSTELQGYVKGKLHIGIAVVPNDSMVGDDVIWYDAMKNAILHGQSADAIQQSLRRRALDRLICNRQIQPVYQPILSIQQGSDIFGYEALTRTKDQTWFPGPLELFHFAEQEGMSYSLDRLAREKAIDSCMPLMQGQKLFINVMAQIMEDPAFSPGQTLSLLEQHKLSPHHVVFEITERSSIADFGSVKKALEHYRSQGYQIAIDDVGAGYSSLQSIVELRPDYLKVDRSIIHNIHLDEMKEHILYTLIQLASKMDISIIAEGIELEEELNKVRQMGVEYAQGYLLGRPAPFQPTIQ